MAYDTKALLIAIAQMVELSKDKQEIYARLAKIANAEGVILEPLKEKEPEKEKAQK